jgi:uncharacterized protein YaeQ
MAGELARRRYGGQVDRARARARAYVSTRVAEEQAAIRGLTTVGVGAAFEVDHLKRVQKWLELTNPDNAEAVALVVNTTTMSIVRRVAQFSEDLD